jgi:putative inorganic carbon (hco3(-)) transporter
VKDKFYGLFKFISEYALYSILFFIPISISLVEISIGLMFVGFIGRKIIKPDFEFIKFQPNIFLLLFLFFSALSLLNSGQYLNISFHALFGKWMKYFGICIIIQDSMYDQKIIKRGIFIFLLSAFLIVISGLSQYIFGIEFLRNKSAIIISGGTHAIRSSFAHYNGFAGYLVVVLSLVTASLLADNRHGIKIISLSVFAIFSTAAIMLTFSRGSWVAVSVSFIFLFALARKNIMRLIPIFLIVVVMFLLPAIYERIGLSFRTGGDNSRFAYWMAALKMINRHPFFGIGLGTFMANFAKYLPGGFKESYAHNCYLQIWAETGIFSLVSFILFMIAVIRLGIKDFIHSRDFLLLGLLSGAIGFLVHSFLDTNMYSLQLAVLFWTLVGLTIARLRMVGK